jgi:hypothetical protein
MSQCLICGSETDASCCSKACEQRLREEIDAELRVESPEVFGPPIIIDPEVGDERQLAYLSAYSHKRDARTRGQRLANLRKNAAALGLPDALCRDMLILAENSPGSNTETVEIDERYFRVYESGHITEERLADLSGYWHKYLDGFWLEIRDDEYAGELQLSPVQPRTTGATVNLVEHGAAAIAAVRNPPPPAESLSPIVHQAIAKWKAARATNAEAAKNLRDETLRGLESAGYNWSMRVLQPAPDDAPHLVKQYGEFVCGGGDAGFVLHRKTAVTGETVYVERFGNAAVLHASRETILRAWQMEREDDRVWVHESRITGRETADISSPAYARDWLRKYPRCAGWEYMTWLSQQPEES